MVKNLPANAGDAKDSGSILGSGRSLGVGGGKPFQYSYLENFMDKQAWQAPLSMGFPRQNYWSGLPFPPTGDPPNPGIKPASLMFPALAGRFFYH